MITRAQYDDLKRRVDRLAPNRARAVVRLLGSVEGADTPNRKERRLRERKQHRHPAQKTARERRKHWHDPSPQEERVRERNRLARKHQERAADEDGEVAGLLGAVAEYCTPQLLEDFGLGESHVAPFQHWLTAKFGDVLRDPDPNGYLAWREQCIATLRDA